MVKRRPPSPADPSRPSRRRTSPPPGQMEPAASSSFSTTGPPAHNDTLANGGEQISQNWAFLVAVLAAAVSLSLLLALLAKCHVVRRYLESYRHTRLRDTDAHSHCGLSAVDVEFAMQGRQEMDLHCSPVREEDDDGFIEDNYIPASERARAERAAENIMDTEEEMDEIQFSIA